MLNPILHSKNLSKIAKKPTTDTHTQILTAKPLPPRHAITRLLKDNLDFLFYEVEGCVNVARKEFVGPIDSVLFYKP